MVHATAVRLSQFGLKPLCLTDSFGLRISFILLSQWRFLVDDLSLLFAFHSDYKSNPIVVLLLLYIHLVCWLLVFIVLRIFLWGIIMVVAFVYYGLYI